MRNVTLKQMRMLAAVVRHGSVTAAAQAIGVSAPAVTMQLRQMQDDIGLALVERTQSGMLPTAAGLEVTHAVARIESVLDECKATLAGYSGAARGDVSVGVVSTAKYFAPRALAGFLKMHPRIDLRLTVGNRADIVERLRKHSIDVAVTGRPPDELPMQADVIGEHPHVIIAPPDHRLAFQRRLAPPLLAAETFLMREPGSGTRVLMERFFADALVEVRMGMQIDSNETIKQAVIAGLGVAFISAHAIEAEVTSRRLVILDVQGLPLRRQWFAVHLRDRPLLPAARLLQQFLTREGKRYLPDVPLPF
jgi:molybdate transport repressor ModE-like protein